MNGPTNSVTWNSSNDSLSNGHLMFMLRLSRWLFGCQKETCWAVPTPTTCVFSRRALGLHEKMSMTIWDPIDYPYLFQYPKVMCFVEKTWRHLMGWPIHRGSPVVQTNSAAASTRLWPGCRSKGQPSLFWRSFRVAQNGIPSQSPLIPLVSDDSVGCEMWSNSSHTLVFLVILDWAL